MTKGVKFVGFTAVVVLVLVASAGAEQVYLDRLLCRQTSDAFIKLHALNSLFHLQGSVAPAQSAGFMSMLKDKALFLTRLREFQDMKDELTKSLSKSGLVLKDLKLADGSRIPGSSSSEEVNLNANEVYEPKDEETFVTQNWVAKIHAKGNVARSIQSWLNENKKSGNIAIIPEPPVVQNNVATLSFSSGMIPGMRMPKRVLSLDHLDLPLRGKGHFPEFVPDVLNYQSCSTKMAARFESLKAGILKSAPKILTDIEHADRTKWFWAASTQSKNFIAKAKQQQE